MEAYKRGSHTVWDCKYDLVWVTKYRYAVLGGDVGQQCRELLRETAQAHELVVHAGSHKLLSEFGILRKRYWGQHLWARGYWVTTSGNVTDEMWVEYIKNQTPPEPDDNFNVT